MTNTQTNDPKSSNSKQLYFHLLVVVLICVVGFFVWQYTFKASVKTTTEFWIWQEIDMQYANQADGVVLMQGEFKLQGDQVIFEKKGLTPHQINHVGEVSILLRAYDLPSASVFIERVDRLLVGWKKTGAKISGIQIDYDSPTDKLSEYQAFLKQLSAYYGKSFLSVTGLASWLGEHITEVNALGEVVDYVAIQFYQLHLPVPNAKEYFNKLDGLTINYKVGVTTSAEFRGFDAQGPDNYLGKLVFLNGKAPL